MQILGNIADFDVKESVAYEDLPVIDKCLIRRAERVFEQMKEAYDLHSSFYLYVLSVHTYYLLLLNY